VAKIKFGYLEEHTLKVTYCASPVLSIREFNMANRILTENLLRNDKLDVGFDYSILDCYLKHDREAFASGSSIDHPYRFSPSLWKEALRMYFASSKYSKIFGDNMKTDIILMSCQASWFDYPFIAELLKKGYRLVLGGTNFTMGRTPEWVKDKLLKLGVNQKHLNNFIIVEGIVDLSTDLHKIIKDWKHTKIIENNFPTVWECEWDYLYGIKKIITSSVGMNMRSESVANDFNNVTFLLNNYCWWGKCAFCGFHLQNKMPFEHGVEAEMIAQNIINTTRRLDTNRIYFSNDYFSFTRKVKKILEIINKHDEYRINCYTGILALKNKEYLHNINKYRLKYLKVGLEAGTDFALSKLNKGYDVSDVDETIRNMGSILDKDVEVTFHSITDSPQRNEDEIKKNYNNLIRWRDYLRKCGIRTNVVATSYAILSEINEERCIDNIYIKPCSEEECESGRVKFLKTMRKTFGEDIIDRRGEDQLVPFNRISTDGKVLHTDFEVLPEETLIKLYGGKNWGWE
jgi:hypothetical protein